LLKASQKLHSKMLEQAAAKIRDGPFDKVTQMIKDMITKLTDAAGEEADHKAYCDKELQDNKNTRDSKTSEVESLTGAKDKLNAEIESLTSQCGDLSKAISELESAMNEATEQRQKENAQNTEAISDAKEAISAVKSALKVLEEFYAKAATATAFAQGPKSDAPESFSAPYTGMGKGKGIVGMLEVILSDFVRLEQETSSEEAEAKAAFDEFSAISTEDKDTKTTTMQDKEKTIIKKTHSLQTTKKDLESTQTELSAAMEYYDKLKPSCLDAGVDYQERVARRQEEIASLTDALKILGEDA
jgi:chromosome segregation ATPase